MDIARWSETMDILEKARNSYELSEVAIQAVERCLRACTREQVAADLDVIGMLYPTLFSRETKSALSLILMLAAVVVSPDDQLIRSMDAAVAATSEDRIQVAWLNSIWRQPQR